MSLLACTPLHHSVIPEWGFCCVTYTDTDELMRHYLINDSYFLKTDLHLIGIMPEREDLEGSLKRRIYHLNRVTLTFLMKLLVYQHTKTQL